MAEQRSYKIEYPYTYARVSAMKAKLLKKADYDKLLKMQIGEITKYLQDFDYKEQINRYGVSLSGNALIEKAIRENLTDSFSKLRRVTEGAVKSIVTEYLKKEDFHNIKTIIRGKFTKTQNEEIRKLLIPAGKLTLDNLNKMISEDDLEKIIDLAKLSRVPEIKLALKTFKEKKELEIIELALDKIFYSSLVAFAGKIPIEVKGFRRFIGAEIDATNIKIILKFKREKISDEVIKNLIFITGASKLSKQKWEKIIAAKTYDAVAKEFEKTPYETIVKNGINELIKSNTLSELDLSLKRFMLKNITTRRHQPPLSIDITLAYMFAKEVELRNLYLIVKSKQLGLEESFIQKELIV